MKATFLCEIEVGDDTDLLSIGEELRDTINSNFQHECLSCRPFAHPTLGIPAQAPGGVTLPSQTKP